MQELWSQSCLHKAMLGVESMSFIHRNPSPEGEVCNFEWLAAPFQSPDPGAGVRVAAGFWL